MSLDFDEREYTTLSQEILDSAKAEAEEAVRDKKSIAMPPEITGIDEPSNKRLEYLLIQDYMQSIGLQVAPEVLRFESLHPTVEEDRKTLASYLDLRSYEKTPLLVQLIAKRLAQIEKMEKHEK
jgi:hypothetical protein